MYDLISRQMAIDALGEKPLAWTEGEYELGLQNQWQSDVDALKALPSAERKGKWIEYNATGKKQWMCSECCAEEKNPKVARFCYWCGAYMRGEEDG